MTLDASLLVAWRLATARVSSPPDVGTEYAACHVQFGAACDAYVRRDGAPVREAPSDGAPAQFSLPGGYELYLPASEGLRPGGQWVRVNAEAPGTGTAHSGWMRRDDVVTKTEFRRVVDCWPVEQLKWNEALNGFITEHGVPLRIKMTAKGRAERSLGGDELRRDGGYGIYYASGLFLVWPDRWPEDDEGWLEIAATFLLDAGRRQVNLFSTAFRLTSDRSVIAPSKFRVLDRACNQGPTVDPTRSLDMPGGRRREMLAPRP